MNTQKAINLMTRRDRKRRCARASNEHLTTSRTDSMAWQFNTSVPKPVLSTQRRCRAQFVLRLGAEMGWHLASGHSVIHPRVTDDNARSRLLHYDVG